MTARRVVAGLSLALVIAGGTWRVTALSRRAASSFDLASAPNVVLIIACTLRADQTTLYTPDLATTPFLDELAQGGVVFEDAVTAAPWTRPAAGAILTGVHPTSLGLHEPEAARSDRVLPDDAVTLAEAFEAVGYATIGRTANPNLASTFGFDQGFADYQNLSPFWRAGVTKVRGAEVVASVLSAVAAAPDDRPRFVQAVFVDAHQPNPLGNAVNERWIQDGVPPRVGRYRAMVRLLDAAVRDLVTGLVPLGLTADNTLYVVVNDHGEGLAWPPSHGKGHGRYLYPSTTRMVWLMAGPGVAGGRQIDGLASQVDLAPTLLDLVGIPVPEGVEGHGWADLVGGAPGDTTRPVAYASTMFSDTLRGAAFTQRRACIVDYGDGAARRTEVRRHKPVFRSGCFDRADATYASRVAAPALRGALDAWWAGGLARLRGRGAVSAEVSEAVQAELRALGYTDDAP